MHIARFLSGIPQSFDFVNSQILANKELPSLSDVFNLLRQASKSNSSFDLTTHSFDQSTLVTTAGRWGNKGIEIMVRKAMGCDHGGHRGRGRESPH